MISSDTNRAANIFLAVFAVIGTITFLVSKAKQEAVPITALSDHTNKLCTPTCVQNIDIELSNRVMGVAMKNPYVKAYEDDFYEVESFGGQNYLIRREDADKDWDHFLDGPEIKVYLRP